MAHLKAELLALCSSMRNQQLSHKVGYSVQVLQRLSADGKSKERVKYHTHYKSRVDSL